MDRRNFLKILAAAPVLSFLPVPVRGEDFWSYPRTLYLYREQTGERVLATYWQNDSLNEDGYKKICHLMRDTNEGRVAQIDLRLLDLMRAVQGWVSYYGYDNPFHVSSGFRTKRTNNSLEGASKNSFHMKGMAVDFKLPGLPADYMGKLAAHYAVGGVGIYTRKGFTHMDSGGRLAKWVR